MTDNLDICPDEVTDCVDVKQFPSMLQMAKNLMEDGTKIISNAVQGNTTLVTDEERNTRWSICQGCPFLTNDRCTKCGCFMKVKVAFQTSKCPEGKW
jgi:Family of unknown function (DUF6171)